MKKMVKKSGVAVLSMAMLLSMGAMALPVSASEGDALTVNVQDVTCGSETYSIASVQVYQVAKRDASTGKWVWNAPFAANVKLPDDLNDLTAVQMNNLAKALKAIVKTNAAAAAKTCVLSENNAKIADVEDVKVDGEGYYLVIAATVDNIAVIQPSLVVIDSKGTKFTDVAPKTNPLPLEKKITAITDGQLSKGKDPSDTSVGIVGSKIEYSITSQIPEYYETVVASAIKPFVITDDPSDGITINNSDFGANGSNVVVKIDNTDVTADVTLAKVDDGFSVTVPGTVVYQYMGKDIVVTFKAEVNANPVYGSESCADAAENHQGFTGNPNTATLTWGNNYATGGYYDPANPDKPFNPDDPDTPDTPYDPTDPDLPDEPDTPVEEKKDTVTTYVGELTLAKQGEGVDKLLEGAEFTLTGLDNNLTQTYTTGADGKFDFGFLPAGEYVLAETKAPSGFKSIDSTYTFTVTNKSVETATEFDTFEFAEKETNVQVDFTENKAQGDVASTNSKAKITVTDPPTDTLPGTGSIGTYVFTFGGLAIVLLAGVLFVIYMKKRKVEE